ncbi:hypothetical protein SEA_PHRAPPUCCINO_132 [Mycobacterium phage Phrappuccino]|uniref:Uncharacterized protein n=1 Tax=Mycobacterium phage Phrappuccino TaxID=2591223 RepID=A0A514DDY5_9CAUD|nr:hypothetical protein KHQ87_gp132 [Mycobacterium phage Phrappuccino]QDH91807.1 hypothetical protein SEA_PHRAPPUCCINO_132 [Mycobacterium phage Phrappuccino]QIQ63249.1 hypothetical protein SEA_SETTECANDELA_132 [Mycobacterium phage Settecandela]
MKAVTVISDDDITPEIEAAVAKEIEQLKAEGKLARIEPRCKICREKPLREVVNKLLSMGLTRPAIVDLVATINEGREGKDQISYDNVYHHQKRHFDVSQPAQAVYEAIVRKRAAEGEADFEAGVGAAVNVLSYLETMMVKGWNHLIDDTTVVPYNDGAKAAMKLHELTRKEAGAQQIAEIMARQNRIIAAMQEFVPSDKVQAMLARIESGEAPAIEGEVVDSAEGFDPDLIGDDDDDDDGD